MQKLSQNHSFFLFGARGTGKTTLLKQLFFKKNNLWIDLLSFDDEDRFSRNPDLLTELIAENKYKRIIIDEIQKVPKLLDIIHLEIERNKNIQFILTGSSARKLKRGGANLLAGRAFTFPLYPLTHIELGNKFKINEVLQFGSLPSLRKYRTIKEKSRYLNNYIQTYLKEEILVEQIIRNIKPFKNFLEISAQCNGQIINNLKVARDLGVDYKTVQNYFDILEDTHLGFYLKSFNRSIRKQQNKAPKFFLFDTGVCRALLKKSQISLENSSFEYGSSFEHFIILELFRLNAYREKLLSISYLRDKNSNEIDLVIQTPKGEEILVEIKFSNRTTKEQGKTLEKFKKDWDRPCTTQLWSNDPKNRKIGEVRHYHWKTALRKLFF
ncbi:MAG: ATP-binding protein [Bdellovibrionales bacterium]|nr:ATP-binding protein [Bdellovibrionales bacterium]